MPGFQINSCFHKWPDIHEQLKKSQKPPFGLREFGHSNLCGVRSLNNWFPSFVSQEDGKLENSIYGRKLSVNLLIF